jgi:hypothetical protein
MDEVKVVATLVIMLFDAEKERKSKNVPTLQRGDMDSVWKALIG